MEDELDSHSEGQQSDLQSDNEMEFHSNETSEVSHQYYYQS